MTKYHLWVNDLYQGIHTEEFCRVYCKAYAKTNKIECYNTETEAEIHAAKMDYAAKIDRVMLRSLIEHA